MLLGWQALGSGLSRRLLRGGFLLGRVRLGDGLGRRRLGRSLAVEQPLLGDLAQLHRKAGDHRAEAADHAGQGAGDKSGELAI